MTVRDLLKKIDEKDYDKNIEICDYYTDNKYNLSLITNDIIATSDSKVLLFAGIHLERKN